MMAIVRMFCSCAWVGTLISGLFAYSASEDEAEAIDEENKQAREDVAQLNKIKLAQYEREQRAAENKQKWEQNKDKISQYERMLNTSVGLRDRLTGIWGKGRFNAG